MTRHTTTGLEIVRKGDRYFRPADRGWVLTTAAEDSVRIDLNGGEEYTVVSAAKLVKILREYMDAGNGGKRNGK